MKRTRMVLFFAAAALMISATVPSAARAGEVFKPDFAALNEREVPDQSVQENNLQLPGQAERRPVRAEGPNGVPAVAFNGNQYAFTRPDVSLMLFAALRVEASVYQEAGAPSDCEQKIVRTGPVNGAFDHWTLSVSRGKLCFTACVGYPGNFLTLEDPDWTAGQWHKAAVLYDGRAFSLFVDGKEKAKKTCGAGLFYAGHAVLYDYQKARDGWKPDYVLTIGGTANGTGFRGKVADLAISVPEYRPLVNANLLINGDSEAGDTRVWGPVNIGAGLENTMSHSGKYSLRLSLSQGNKSGYVISSFLPACAGATYVMSFWARAGAGMNKESGWYYLGANPDFVRLNRFTSGTEWSRVESTFVLPESYKCPVVYAVLGLEGYPGPLWIDDVSVVVTEPPKK